MTIKKTAPNASGVKGLARRRSASRPSRADATGIFPAGTFLGVPLGDGRFAYARIIDSTPANSCSVVVYTSRGTAGAFDASSAVTSDLRIPPFQAIVNQAFRDQLVVLATPDEPFVPGPLERAIRFAAGPGEGSWYAANFRLDEPLDTTPLPVEVAARTLVDRSMKGVDLRVAQVREATERDARWSPGDPDPEMVRAVELYEQRRKADEERGRPLTYEEKLARLHARAAAKKSIG